MNLLVGMPLFVPNNEEIYKYRFSMYETWSSVRIPTGVTLLVILQNGNDEIRSLFNAMDNVIIVESDPISTQLGRAVADKYALDNGFSHILHVDDDFVVKPSFVEEDLERISRFDRANLINSRRMVFTALKSRQVLFNCMNRLDEDVLMIPANTKIWEQYPEFENVFVLRDGILTKPGDYINCIRWVPQEDDWNNILVSGEDSLLSSYLALHHDYYSVRVRGLYHQYMKSNQLSLGRTNINSELIVNPSEQDNATEFYHKLLGQINNL